MPEGSKPTDDPIVEEEYQNMTSHLLCHSDAEGFYAPIDFQDVIADDRLVGGLLGSSFRLRDELIEIAPALGISLQNGQLSDEEADAVNAGTEDGMPLSIEKMAWIALYEAARLSIQHKTAICFT